MQGENNNMKNVGKNVGMVTLYSDNYGSCLQAYSLYRTIVSLGYNPILIKYNRANSLNNRERCSKLQKLMKLPFKKILHLFLNYRMVRGRKFSCEQFRKKYLSFTEYPYSSGRNVEINERFDAFVCGSDMMWCEVFADDWEQYFLRFTQKRKRIAYAPSFGINKISLSNFTRCKLYLEGFDPDCLSCRDKSGVTMIEQKFGLSARHVVDPTMLLSKNEWNQVIDHKPLINDRYVLLYLFGGTSGNRKKIIEQVKGWNLGKIKAIAIDGKYHIHNPNIGPLEYVRLFRDAEFIITDTFHGLMFSLIFEKPFVVLTREDGVNWAQYSDRMTAQLDLLEIPERYHDMNDPLPDEFRTLDYTRISRQLEELRNDSLDYLSGALDRVTQKW